MWFPTFGLCQGTSALDVCKAIVDKAAHNVYLSTSSYVYYDSLYDSYCRVDGSTKSEWLNSAAKIVYEEVPMQGGENAGASEMSVSQFCRTYSSKRIQHGTSYTKNTEVVEKALVTTADCVRFASSNNTIEHTFGTPQALTLTITPFSGNTITITSVGHDRNVTCVGSGKPGQSNITYDIGTKFKFDAGWGPYAIECTRTSLPQSDGGQLYEAASLSLTSSAGNYHVFWPQATVEPERIAEKIAQDMATLRAQVTILQQRLAAIGNESDQAQHGFTRGGGNQNYACPPGQFVSAIAATEWNSNHPDALVANIAVQCRKALVSNSDKQ
jgi:hypothetical protein